MERLGKVSELVQQSIGNSIKRILICDDIADNCFLLEAILQAEDYKIEIVNSGAEVLNKIETDPEVPDLLLVDVLMPQIDGYEVVRRIRQSKKFEFISILLVTSFDKDDAKLADDIKIDGFIQKPFDLDAVIAQVRTILD
ncbi:response regulator [uncultured Nostoc sp.]|uniref:response regulator n=1 Tax=uncultured Nostoc sp. TaxID=340711 RepID=UPI0035CBD4E0